MTRDEYLQLMGLEPHATWEEVKEAYLGLCGEWNPASIDEKSEGYQEAQERWDQLQEAYNYLSHDVVVRARTSKHEVDGPLGTSHKRLKTVTKESSSDISPEDKNEVNDPLELEDTPHGAEIQEGEDLPLPLLIGVLTGLGIGALLMVVLLITLMVRKNNAVNIPVAQEIQIAKSTPAQNISNSQQVAHAARPVRSPKNNLYIPAGERLLEQARSTSTFLSEEEEVDVTLDAPPLFAGSAVDDSSTAPVSAPNPDDIPLIQAPKLNYKSRDKLYIIEGNKVQAQEAIKSYTPDIIDAVIRCKPKEVLALIQDGADINEVDTSGETPLIWSVKRRCKPVAKLLLKKGAKVNAKGPNGFTPYVWARLYGDQAMIKLLVKNGAKTSKGGYWWRFKEDGSKQWIDREYANACRGRNCG